ncbi:MAG TPA: DinB family protein [Terriglobales bacterium]|nr:DinB family protein [Terriglobales bacterium]
MADVNDVLAANRAAVLDLVAASERSAATWTTPRAPGKWSPSQVVEHVARGGRRGQRRLWGAVDPDAPRFPAPAAQTVLQPDLEEGRISERVEGPQGVKPRYRTGHAGSGARPPGRGARQVRPGMS